MNFSKFFWEKEAVIGLICKAGGFAFRGMSEWCKGSSILMKEHSQWVELAGHDYVMDLISDLELPTDFPKQKSYFIISTDDPARVRAKTSLSVYKTRSGSLTSEIRWFLTI